MLKQLITRYKAGREIRRLKRVFLGLKTQEEFVEQIDKLLKSEVKKLDDLIKVKMELENGN